VRETKLELEFIREVYRPKGLLAYTTAAGFPAGLLGFLAGAVFLLWTPGEYVAAMRGGVACVKPRRYVPALTC
jgi:hypothetical protein